MTELRIKELMRMKHVTRPQIAKAAGLYPNSFSVALKKKSFSIAQLDSMADYLGVHITELFDQPTTVYVEYDGKKFPIALGSIIRLEKPNPHRLPF